MTAAGVVVQEQHKGRAHVCPTWVSVAVGRDPGCAFAIKEESVSRRHCELYADIDGSLKVKDTSSQGTFLNGAKVEGEAVARTGDELRLGRDVRLIFVGPLYPSVPRRDPQGQLTLPQRLTPNLVLLRAVGHGGAGVVFEAMDEALRRRVAVKLLLLGGRASDELLERFRREAAVQASLKDYPGIVRFHELGKVPDSGELFFTMEFVAGGTLRQKIKDGLPGDHVAGARLMARIARAVHYAHEHQIVHRDLKPGNVMLTPDDAIRLTDFGVAKALEDEQSITLTGVMMGTPNYMAPEQVEDAKRVGPEADIYGLGAICYHALTGHPPFLGDDLNKLLDDVVQGRLLPPEQVDPKLDPELAGVVKKAMARAPGDRWPTALALAKALEAWARRVDPPARVTLRPSQPS
jgi:serine/threonine protein kinase